MNDKDEWKWEVVTKRIESMPSHMKLAIGSSGTLSKDDMLLHLHKKDPTGKRIVEMQMNYLKFMKHESEKAS